MSDGIAVVGAGAAALATAEELRALGYRGRIAIFGDETRRPYDRPAVSKQLLTGQWDDARAQLPTDVDVDWHLGQPVAGLRLADGRVALADGQELTFSKMVIATGVQPRRPGFIDDLAAVHYIRTIDDVNRLKMTFQPHQNVVVLPSGRVSWAQRLRRG